MTSPADRWTRPLVRATMPSSSRSYGNLDAITDSERRGLRPIGTTAHEVAARTGALLDDLLTLGSVRIFQGVRAMTADGPRVPHVISAGSHLIFVDSVAWPPGRYVITASGRIHCDGVYTGQSAQPLITAIRHWREILPDDHRVTAFVVVHPTAAGELALPAATGRILAWARASDAVRSIRAHLPHDRQVTSMRAVAALVAAIAEE